jgi:hypothetical protein
MPRRRTPQGRSAPRRHRSSRRAHSAPCSRTNRSAAASAIWCARSIAAAVSAGIFSTWGGRGGYGTGKAVSRAGMRPPRNRVSTSSGDGSPGRSAVHATSTTSSSTSAGWLRGTSPVPAGASWTSWCAFVPPNPNPETPTVRGRPGVRGSGVSASGTVSFGERARSARSVTRCCAGTTPWRRPSSAWISETAPAAQPVWPTSDLLLVHSTGSAPVEPVSAASSTSSPAGVPVPWATTQGTSSARAPAVSRARAMASACPRGLGA